MLDSAAVLFMKPVKISEFKSRGKPGKDLVLALERLLSLARKGEIDGFCYFALKGTGSRTGKLMLTDSIRALEQMVGGMQLLMHEIVSDISAESEVVCLEIDGDETQE